MTFNLRQCLMAKSEEGRVLATKAQRAVERFEKLQQLRDEAILAADQVLQEEAEALARSQWTKMNEIARQADAIRRIDEHLGKEVAGLRGRRRISPRQIASSFFDFDARQQVAGPSIYREFEATRSQAHAIVNEVIEQFRPRLAGLADPQKREIALQENIIREMFGEDSGDDLAKQMSTGLKEALEFLRTEFNRAGGNIAFREDFGMPQQHDPKALERVGKQQWINETLPLLDREKMINENTGQPFTDDELIEVLDETYDTIVSRGLNDIDPTDPKFGSKITTRHQHRRFLQFRNADDWLAYQRKFGPAQGEVMTTMARHIDIMARDIAAMRTLGPNPRATIRLVADTLQQRTGQDVSDLMERQFLEATGKTNIPVAGDGEFWAGAGIATRNTLKSATLGQSFFSAITDVGFSQMAANMAGIPQMRLLQRHLALMNPSNAADRRQAIRLGLGAMGAIEKGQAAARVSGEGLGDPNTAAGVTRGINDFVMRAGLLQPWTEAGRWAFGTEVLATLTERAGQRLDQLEEPLRNALQRNGIDEKTWDAIRNAPKFRDPETGADFIRPMEIMQNGDADAARALQRMISTETEFAVPSSFVPARALLTAGTRPGTLMGEILRFAGMLKNFPVTVLMLQGMRIAAINGGLNKAKYTAQLMAMTGALGVLGEQLSTIADGQTPRPMTPGEEGFTTLILDGMWRAGSFGLLGDFVFTNFDRYGSSISESLLGPAFDQANRLQGLTAGNVIQALTEDRQPGESVLEQTDAGRELVDFVRRMTPGQNLWFTNLVTQRLVFDQLQKLADPEYDNSFRRMEQIAEDQGSTFFFKPGATLPESLQR